MKLTDNFCKFIENTECWLHWDKFEDEEDEDGYMITAFFNFLEDEVENKDYFLCSYTEDDGSRIFCGTKNEVENFVNHLYFSIDKARDDFAIVYDLKNDREVDLRILIN